MIYDLHNWCNAYHRRGAKAEPQSRDPNLRVSLFRLRNSQVPITICYHGSTFWVYALRPLGTLLHPLRCICIVPSHPIQLLLSFLWLFLVLGFDTTNTLKNSIIPRAEFSPVSIKSQTSSAISHQQGVLLKNFVCICRPAISTLSLSCIIFFLPRVLKYDVIFLAC